MMMMSMEQSVGLLAKETEVLAENLPKFHFDHQKSHITLLGFEPGPPR
jgi:hypothetical protein